MRLTKEGEWLLKGEIKHLYKAATKENATYCLDRAISVLSKKQSHGDLSRWLSTGPEDKLSAKITRDTPLLDKASKDTPTELELKENSTYEIHSIVSGLDGTGRFAEIFHIQKEEPKFISGYIDFQDCELFEK